MKFKQCQKILIFTLLISVNSFAGDDSDADSTIQVNLPAPQGQIDLLGRDYQFNTSGFSADRGLYGIGGGIGTGMGAITNTQLYMQDTTAVESYFPEVNLFPGLNIQNRNGVKGALPGLNYGNYNGPLRTTDFWWTNPSYNNWMTNIRVGDASDAILFNSSDIFNCAVDPDTPLLAAFKQVENQAKVQACTSNRRTKRNSPREDEESLLNSDIQTCGCLRGENTEEDMSFAQPLMNQTLAANPMIVESETSNRIRNEINDIYNNQLSTTLNGILGYAGVVLNNPQQAVDFSNNVFVNAQAVAEGEGSINLNYRPEPEKLFKDDFPLADGQCVTFTEYLREKMIPQGRDFELVSADFTAGPEQWDYSDMQERYEVIMNLKPQDRLQHVDEIEKIKAKLVFLERNPLLKYYLGSDEASPESKSTLIQHMQDLNQPDCLEITSECTEKFHGKIQSFFTGSDAGGDSQDKMAIVRKGAREYITEKARKKASKDFISTPDDLTLRNGRASQRHLTDRFFNNLKITRPDNCTLDQNMVMTERTATECLQVFSAYCKTIDSYEKLKDESSADPRVKDDLDELLNFDYRPSLADNADYRNFNQVQCGQRQSTHGRAILGIRDSVDWAEFMRDECKDRGQRGCQITSIEELARLRLKFYQKYPRGVNGSVETPKDSYSNGTIPRVAGTPRYFSPERPRWDSISEVADFDNGVARVSAATASYTNAGSVQTNQINNLRNESDSDSFSYSNYNNLGAGTSVAQGNQVANTEVPRVQDMDQERRQELLNDWEEEYNSWKANKGSNLSPGDQARDSELRTEISTLRALLEQQRQISDQQYQLLNDAIAARTRLEQENIARTQERERNDSRNNRESVESSVTSRSAIEGDVNRAPASIPDQQLNSAGAVGGGSSTAGAASLGGAGSGARSAAIGPNGSSDSVAREEAKLVNLRQNTDGSIVIVPSGNGTNTQANAITLAVSDEQYQILKTNPRGLNLGQIERSIPRDQIAQLERNGEIILLLRNGQNPPYEVKVKKQNNKLVYSVVDQNGREQAPVRRVFTRNALLNNLTQ